MKNFVLVFSVLCFLTSIFAQDPGIPGMRVVSSGPSSARMRASPFLNERREFNRPHRVNINNAPVVFPTIDVKKENVFVNNPVDFDPQRTPNVAFSDGDVLPDTGESIQLELPEDLDIEDMQVGVRERDALSNLRSAEDFLKLFNLQAPPEEENDNNGIFARFGGRPAVDTVNAVCAPENQTVALDLPRELNVVFFPNCVRLMRCGGCCHGPLLSCQPTKRSAVTLKILKVGTGGSSSRTSTRNAPEGSGRSRTRTRNHSRTTRNRSRREETTTYVDIQEYHDTECKCMCRIRPEHCDMQIQTYSADECLCRCKNQDEKLKCQNKSDTHYWDKKSCNCYCKKEDTCSTGQRFDHADCKCIKFSGFLRSGLTGRSAGESLGPPNGGSAGDPPAFVPVIF